MRRLDRQREETVLNMANKLTMLVPTSAIANDMTDADIARCQAEINAHLSLYPATRDALVVVADLARNTAIPVYQHMLDDAFIRDRLPVYHANEPLAEALRTSDYATGFLIDTISEALDIYAGYHARVHGQAR